MSEDTYVYAQERERLFTEDGQRDFLAMRDAAMHLIAVSGAARASEIMGLAIKKVGAADSWQQVAALDRMVELGEIRELTDPEKVWGQYRVFVRVERTA